MFINLELQNNSFYTSYDYLAHFVCVFKMLCHLSVEIMLKLLNSLMFKGKCIL